MGYNGFRAFPKEGTITKTAVCRYTGCARPIVWTGDIFDGHWEHLNGALKCSDADATDDIRERMANPGPVRDAALQQLRGEQR